MNPFYEAPSSLHSVYYVGQTSRQGKGLFVRQGPSAFNKIHQLIHLMNGNDASGPSVIQLRLGKGVWPNPATDSVNSYKKLGGFSQNLRDPQTLSLRP